VRKSPPVARSLTIAVLACAALSLLAAGCGGTKSYSLADTRACLAKEKGVRITNRVDFIADTALGGGMLVKLPSRNRVTVSFGLDQDEADRLAGGYRRFRGKNIGIEDVLRPDHNAVLLWKEHPSEEDISSVTGCLK
jgi:hypothetical protein